MRCRVHSLAAWFDHALAKRNVSYHIALTALFGYAISYLPLAMAYWVGFAHGPEVLLFGLIEMLVFIFILVVGYYYAWQKGALEWA